jgi:hypothetical protein
MKLKTLLCLHEEENESVQIKILCLRNKIDIRPLSIFITRPECEGITICLL